MPRAKGKPGCFHQISMFSARTGRSGQLRLTNSNTDCKTLFKKMRSFPIIAQAITVSRQRSCRLISADRYIKFFMQPGQDGFYPRSFVFQGGTIGKLEVNGQNSYSHTVLYPTQGCRSNEFHKFQDRLIPLHNHVPTVTILGLYMKNPAFLRYEEKRTNYGC